MAVGTIGLKIIKRTKCHHLMRLTARVNKRRRRLKKKRVANSDLCWRRVQNSRHRADMQPQVIIRIVCKQPAAHGSAREAIIHIGLYELILKAKTNRHQRLKKCAQIRPERALFCFFPREIHAAVRADFVDRRAYNLRLGASLQEVFDICGQDKLGPFFSAFYFDKMQIYSPQKAI